MELKFSEQLFVKNTCTEFYGSSTDGFVADIRLQTDGHALVYFVNNTR